MADSERRPELSPPGDGEQGDAERGRGLELVDNLSSGSWGVAERVVGKTVWAQIKRPAPLVTLDDPDGDGPRAGVGYAEAPHNALKEQSSPSP